MLVFASQVSVVLNLPAMQRMRLIHVHGKILRRKWQITPVFNLPLTFSHIHPVIKPWWPNNHVDPFFLRPYYYSNLACSLLSHKDENLNFNMVYKALSMSSTSSHSVSSACSLGSRQAVLMIVFRVPPTCPFFLALCYVVILSLKLPLLFLWNTFSFELNLRLTKKLQNRTESP